MKDCNVCPYNVTSDEKEWAESIVIKALVEKQIPKKTEDCGCSVCGTTFREPDLYVYCPICGQKTTTTEDMVNQYCSKAKMITCCHEMSFATYQEREDELNSSTFMRQFEFVACEYNPDSDEPYILKFYDFN